MDIDKIEANLNTYESNPERVLAIVLNTAIRNQALLETLMDYQLGLMSILDPEINIETLQKEISTRTEKNLLEIQALVASQLSGEE